MPNTNQIQLSEQSQAWLNTMLSKSRYCHYFAVCIHGNEIYPMGNWNAPFYSIEEAKQFKDMMQAKHPSLEFSRIEGTLHIDGAMKDIPNKFWATWQKKHEQRIAALMTLEA